MTAKSDLLIEELVSAAVAFGRGQLPDWQTRIERARVKLCEYIDEVEGLEEDSGSYDSLIPDWANEPKQRWIPVSDRLPEIEEGDSKEYDVVITYPHKCSVIVASWTYSAFDKTHQRRIWIEEQGEFGDKDITKYVTHWRERPTPPEVQE